MTYAVFYYQFLHILGTWLQQVDNLANPDNHVVGLRTRLHGDSKEKSQT